MNGCPGITDAAFVHLKGIQTLDMAYCTGITDAAFVHLAGIHTLTIDGCKQITDAALPHLSGIKNLLLWGCTQASLTQAALLLLKKSSRRCAISGREFR